jgi:hypothetical protein
VPELPRKIVTPIREILTYKIDIPEAHTLQEEYGHELLTALQEMGSRGRAFNGSF